MFLKSLTLQGFKSFGQRTVLELPRGVAAVVGPNGSGKSNISDAIRWVLGEQSIRVLRGTRLEDVIFAGSDSRKAVGMAEVSLTFDNGSKTIPLEFSEVTVTRRVYRSGESEFLINKTPCRLRDIQELFMDTGIGRGSLAIIGQGEVDAVLSARPEERRAFLEEAAGISKYRSRKAEALRKLGETSDNLTRLGDIIAEVSRQLDPLAKQAEAARAYGRLAEEKRRIDATLMWKQKAACESERQQAQAALDAALELRRTERLRLQALEEAVAEKTARIDECERRLEAARRRIEEAKESEIGAAHKEEMALARIELAEKEESSRRGRVHEIRARLERLAKERDEAARAAEEAAGAWGAAEAQRAAVLAALDAERQRNADGDQSLARGQSELNAVTERVFTLKSRAEALEEREASWKERRDRHAALAAGLEERERQARALLEEAEARSRETNSRYEQLGATIRRDKERLEQLAREQKAREAEAAEATRALHDVRARRKALSDMEEAREGYNRGVRAVLQASKSRPWRLLGAVAELLGVPAELEAAIETALGSAQQYVVAASDEDAKEAIEYLKEKRLGRATFLPLDSLRPQVVADQAVRAFREIPGAVGVASELVSAPEEVRPAVLYLLGRVAVTRDLDAAVLAARRVRGFARVVTLDGDVVVPGGAMTGGSRRERSEGLLGRNRQIAELREQEAALALRLEESEAARARLGAEAAALRAAIEESEERRRRLEIERFGALRDVKEAGNALEEARRALADWQETSSRLAEEGDSLRTERERVVAEAQEAEARKSALHEEVRALEERLARDRSRAEEMRRELEALRVSLAALEETLKTRRRELERLEAEIVETGSALKAEEDALQALGAEVEEARARIDEARGARERARVDREEAQSEWSRIEAERANERQARDELLPEIAALRARLEEIQSEETEARVRLDRSENQLRRVLEEMAALGVGEEAPQDSELENEPVAVLQRRSRILGARLEAMGPVNPGSVEEYEAVSERHAFLTSQREDLEKAQAQLREVIERIDRESRAKFTATFKAVQQEFASVFKRLFGGGVARLELVDPSDPLESGIDIYVQPPGKKLQNLVALSGGERALAATALLFAILSVRPSPFCVLDEIDAALDEHNLQRFRGLLEEFSASTQFLVITHRQGTMETADCLFGVTMEESGVSRLVSLKMEGARTA